MLSIYCFFTWVHKKTMFEFWLIFILIGVLILVHEVGHFYVARKLGVRVEEFSIGFGKKVFSRMRRGVRYSVRMLPFGGFVKLYGEHGGGEDDPESYSAQPAWKRFLILSAGVAMNIVAGWVFFSAAAAIGLPTPVSDGATGVPVSIIEVSPHSPAADAGLRFGDIIESLEIGGVRVMIATEQELIDAIGQHKEEEVFLHILRGSEQLTLRAIPRQNPPAGEGALGVSLARLQIQRASLLWAPIEGGLTLWRTTAATMAGLKLIASELVFRRRAPEGVSGPVGIFFFAHDIARLGFSYLLQFAGVISVNLAVMNFLPIPLLDGGWVFLLFVEKLRGGVRLGRRAENAALALGFAVLGTLMIAVTYQDILRNGHRLVVGLRSMVPF